ncbi:thiol-disulfide oxidoreductase DCC family protein [Paenibacillus pinistramenti]|uniref:thiol-disulfide oxidoreductase DCC family protein n=1 Tax=Paenibacillus pinistramenti TaxID=1768003 RepID=UPI001108D4D6|nr:thiol-disulfide oxidoreductase DCC family protein [Paenibacillus pinistramenti]
MKKPAEHPIVLIDGVCHLCQGAAKFIIRRDPKGYFRFASLQSETGRMLLSEYGISVPESEHGEAEVDTVVLIEHGKYYIRSDAALRIAARLKFPWSLLRVMRLIPRPMRDGIYRLIAKRRYRWFGKDEACMVPTPELAERFVVEARHKDEQSNEQ